jgi:hypothetical protein
VNIANEKMPRLVAELHAHPLSLWERAGVRVLGTAKITIKAKLPARRSAQRKGGRGLGYGG